MKSGIGPFFRLETTRLTPPFSLPSNAGWLGGPFAVHLCRKTLPLGGIILISRPKSVSCLSPPNHAVGQTTSALHVMANLQVHRAKALKQMHKGNPEDFTQQFSAVQKQTEAIQHIWPRHDPQTCHHSAADHTSACPSLRTHSCVCFAPC